MKTLFLVRHAKSDWGDPALADHARPLNARGLRDAPAMGRRLVDRGVVPGLILSSTALRARTTAEAFAAAFELEPGASVVLDPTLYATTTSHLLETVQGIDDAVETAMLVGHNPEFSGFVARLTGEHVELVTCAVAECRIDVDHWADVAIIGWSARRRVPEGEDRARPAELVRVDVPVR
ncbi:histidine phosphatase family protein [Agromyces protaetiae]|uniref:Histidine phosphatase family protein n=1 Tax=Agromyces protaetiae TaxID=2509455 RepID=A0A4P6FQV4_9MICO|nr:histidine phosphatase family protein [Agromyces protaetiae]QAY72908.1 histidine phosphatase family protein [Agromyces protaetiae]